MPMPPKHKPTPTDPKAKVAIQLEFETKDRAILLRIANAFESMARSLDKMANPPKAENLHPTWSEISKT